MLVGGEGRAFADSDHEFGAEKDRDVGVTAADGWAGARYD